MKTLAVLLNDNDGDRELIQYAAHLAGDLKASLQLLYIQVPHGYVSHGVIDVPVAQIEANYNASAKIAREKIDKLLLEIRDEIPPVTMIDYKSEIGVPSLILDDMVSGGEIDMVLLKSSPDEAFWLQTNSNMDIIRNVLCPVWIIAPDKKYKHLSKIIYATDYLKEDINTLKRLIDLTGSFATEITALHISETDDFSARIKETGFDEMLKQRAGFSNIRAKSVANKEGRDLAEILNEEAVKTDADLIVVLKENKTFFERIFGSSFTSELIKKADLPVLVFHEKK
jgi:nucleotide-binding universal stress UspA family protein